MASYLLPSHGSGPVEQFGVVMLDTKHRVIRTTGTVRGDARR